MKRWIHASTTSSEDICVGMEWWTEDGCRYTVTEVDDSLRLCKIRQMVVGEEPTERVFRIGYKDGRGEYAYLRNHPQFKLFVDESCAYQEAAYRDYAAAVGSEEDYTPSATRGDYSPSNPWDAPGMSMKDFF